MDSVPSISLQWIIGIDDGIAASGYLDKPVLFVLGVEGWTEASFSCHRTT
ncbi:MAG: hypothetical protein HGA41_06835 [Syntrophaceae bacterium]|nr:hypothetical protein [Syntrophaceae bacterium]